MTEVVASAPGKVLLTGGYLVLEKPNSGIVLSTNARFYAIVKPIYDEIQSESWSWAWTDVRLTSPQLSRESMYKLSLKNCSLQCLSPSESRNPYVEQAVQYTVAAARVKFHNEKRDALTKLLLQGLDITILGDNGFYSYRDQLESRGLPIKPESLATLPRFTSIKFNSNEGAEKSCKPEVAKTGLGSSAAMTTAVVAALLQYLGAVHLSPFPGSNESDGLDLIHIIAQTAHCIAQGKIGSGFDISSAVYGSHRYVRFSPSVIASAQKVGKGMTLEEAALDIMNEHWDNERTRFSLPPLMTLLLGEPGSGGSSTPSMVGAVKKWQSQEPEKYYQIWKGLSDANADLESRFRALGVLAESELEAYQSVIQACCRTAPPKWCEHAADEKRDAVVEALIGARNAMLRIRSCMRRMGEAAGVPIEPESQTKLLDLTMETEGVLVAGIPGAGGFDAVFAVALADSGAGLAAKWCSLNVLPLLVREDPRGVSLETCDPRGEDITSAVSAVQIS